MPVHMLHIGKTGGSAIKHALRPVAKEAGIILHNHPTRLADIPAGEPFFVFLRDPIARFVSAFNSRLRCGRPRLNSRWNEPERLAFGRFPTPNALAEAIGMPAANIAMLEIRHVNTFFADWLVDVDYLLERRPLLVGWQESLADDFAKLCALLGLKGVALPTDPVADHRTPDGFSRDLSQSAVANLEAWYARDLAFKAKLRQRMER